MYELIIPAVLTGITILVLLLTADVINKDKKARIILEIRRDYAREEMREGMHDIMKFINKYKKNRKESGILSIIGKNLGHSHIKQIKVEEYSFIT